MATHPSNFWQVDSPETSSSRGRVANSDEEVRLAATNPKKRAGRKKFNETRHPVYRGVRMRNSNKWVCELREPNKQSRIWLGTYPTAEMAARAHDVAALALRGHLACLNFADSVWRLPVPSSTDANDIRQAAVEAAEMFRPMEEGGCGGGVEEGVKNVGYTDDEAMFDMPGLLVNMAEGLMLSPPPHYLWGGGGERSDDGDNGDGDLEVSLWSY